MARESQVVKIFVPYPPDTRVSDMPSKSHKSRHYAFFSTADKNPLVQEQHLHILQNQVSHPPQEYVPSPSARDGISITTVQEQASRLAQK